MTGNGSKLPDRTARSVIALAVLAIGPVAVLAPAGMSIVLGLMAIGSVGVIVRNAGWPRRGTPRVPLWIVLGLAFLLYLPASDLWTPLGDGAERALRLSVLLLFAVPCWKAMTGLTEGARRFLLWTLLAGIGIAILLLMIETASDNGINALLGGPTFSERPGAYHRAASVLAVLAGPLAAAAWSRGHPGAAILLSCLLVAAISVHASTAALVAVCVGLTATALAVVSARLVAALGILTLVASGLVVPVIATTPKTVSAVAGAFSGPAHSSFQHRIVIWSFAADRSEERPWLGWGVRGSRYIPGADTAIGDHVANRPALRPLVPMTLRNPTATVMPLHPHNAPLQARLELGLTGFGLLVLAVSAALWRVASSGKTVRVAILGGTLAALTIWSLSFGLWQSWWIASVLLATVLSASLAETPEERAARSMAARERQADTIPC